MHVYLRKPNVNYMNRYYTLLCIAVLLVAACNLKKRDRKPVVVDTTINTTTSFNNFFFDSTTLVQFLASDSLNNDYAADYFDFYKQRNFQYAWFDCDGITSEAVSFIHALSNALDAEIDSTVIQPETLRLMAAVQRNDKLKNLTQREQLRNELLLTGQFFNYAKSIYKGADVDASELGWFIPRKKIALASILEQELDSTNNDYEPLNPQYQALRSYLVKLLAAQKQYDWDHQPIALSATSLRKGDSANAIKAIKERLYVYGDYVTNDTTPYYDTAFEAAVKRFQKRYGLTADGVIGKTMLSELNDSIGKRIKQIRINMERVRWMPKIEDSVYILVNIPEYRLHIFEHKKLVKDIRVIVGTTANSTVIFSGRLKYIVFSPYWNVPSSIVQKELLPAMQRDPNYLARNNMEVYGGTASLPMIRQKPGGSNSLGLVKFLFPNNYNIYLHDTPNRGLFNATNRSFSHGCIRVGEPAWLAQYLLRNNAAWDSTSIYNAMHQTQEKWVTLPSTVPVFIGYFTAWVDQDGKLNFRKDIYGHDKKMEAKLFYR